MKDAPLSNLSRQVENQLMVFSDSSWQDCPDTGKTTGTYIIFYQGGPIYHVPHVTLLVDQ